MSTLQNNTFSNQQLLNNIVDSYDPTMSNYINTIVAYNFLQEKYLEDLSSPSEKIKEQSEQKWNNIKVQLENNIRTIYNRLDQENSRFLEDAKQILEKTIGLKNQSSIA